MTKSQLKAIATDELTDAADAARDAANDAEYSNDQARQSEERAQEHCERAEEHRIAAQEFLCEVEEARDEARDAREEAEYARDTAIEADEAIQELISEHDEDLKKSFNAAKGAYRSLHEKIKTLSNQEESQVKRVKILNALLKQTEKRAAVLYRVCNIQIAVCTVVTMIHCLVFWGS